MLFAELVLDGRLRFDAKDGLVPDDLAVGGIHRDQPAQPRAAGIAFDCALAFFREGDRNIEHAVIKRGRAGDAADRMVEHFRGPQFLARLRVIGVHEVAVVTRIERIAARRGGVLADRHGGADRAVAREGAPMHAASLGVERIDDAIHRTGIDAVAEDGGLRILGARNGEGPFQLQLGNIRRVQARIGLIAHIVHFRAPAIPHRAIGLQRRVAGAHVGIGLQIESRNRRLAGEIAHHAEHLGLVHAAGILPHAAMHQIVVHFFRRVFEHLFAAVRAGDRRLMARTAIGAEVRLAADGIQAGGVFRRGLETRAGMDGRSRGARWCSAGSRRCVLRIGRKGG